MRLVIVGPPGAGKGTQAVRLAAHYGVPAVSTGDIFRQNIADRTELGQRVQHILDAGGYVPDDVTNALVRERLSRHDAHRGFLLDGYPRTKAQVDELDSMLTEHGHVLDVVVELTVDREEIVARLLKRAQTQGRTDDTEDVVRARQQIYAEETAPLVELYRQRGLLVAVDGSGAVDEVAERLVAAVDGVRAARA